MPQVPVDELLAVPAQQCFRNESAEESSSGTPLGLSASEDDVVVTSRAAKSNEDVGEEFLTVALPFCVLKPCLELVEDLDACMDSSV